ncbi:ATP-binding protein [Frankia sp. AgB1.9]|uniref:ATP-binding protein n=1 Tax=unclassified Frankia TaxID=2632575 RepID=UPI001932A108|nr:MULTISPECIES: ATP-binding protein [unclassified Frankia]MBL7490598.1 ATP-binding protein [Frankia sp. AgW1.1]MBL7552482.1 ATP-binding protein [Frankia sp. AgB1.9]MBL7622097.1 ATP-binding protein [Frankia sp. AgB1.8]
MESELAEEFWIPPDPAAIRGTRYAVLRLCRETNLPADTRETAVLLTSETVTNAIVHGGPPAHLVIRVSPGIIRVEVTDSTDRLPVVVPARPDATNGRGIGLVDALATRWGVQRHSGGKTVWFEISQASPTNSPPPTG